VPKRSPVQATIPFTYHTHAYPGQSQHKYNELSFGLRLNSYAKQFNSYTNSCFGKNTPTPTWLQVSCSATWNDLFKPQKALILVFMKLNSVSDKIAKLRIRIHSCSVLICSPLICD